MVGVNLNFLQTSTKYFGLLLIRSLNIFLRNIENTGGLYPFEPVDINDNQVGNHDVFFSKLCLDEKKISWTIIPGKSHRKM